MLDAGGRVVDASPALRETPLVSRAEVRRALRGTIVVEHAETPVEDDPVRLLATPATAGGRELVVVVGAETEPGDEARTEIGTLLLVGGPIALLLASLAGYAAADSGSDDLKAVITGFAAGALLVMLVDSMIPHATRKGGQAAGLATVLGFAVAFGLA